MRRAQARMVQGTGPEASGLTVLLRSDFYESRVPLQVGLLSQCGLSLQSSFLHCIPNLN